MGYSTLWGWRLTDEVELYVTEIPSKYTKIALEYESSLRLTNADLLGRSKFSFQTSRESA